MWFVEYTSHLQCLFFWFLPFPLSFHLYEKKKNLPHCAHVAAALDGVHDGSAVARIASHLQNGHKCLGVQMNSVVQVSGFGTDLIRFGHIHNVVEC